MLNSYYKNLVIIADKFFKELKSKVGTDEFFKIYDIHGYKTSARFMIVIHDKTFDVMPKYDLHSQTVTFEVYKTVMKPDTIGDFAWVKLNMNFTLNNQGLNTNPDSTEDSDGEEFIKLFIDEIYPNK